jgi:hypothetical protein
MRLPEENLTNGPNLAMSGIGGQAGFTSESDDPHRDGPMLFVVLF